MAEDTDRRSALTWCLFGLGTIFSAILGVPIVAYTIDPRHRKGKGGDFKRIDGVLLNDLKMHGPQQGVIRDTRRDGWNLYPNDVVGRVWVVMEGARPDVGTTAQLEAFNRDAAAKKNYLRVFTTICPHLGCSVNMNAAGNGFQCPCHQAVFDIDGARVNLPGHANPAARNMDELDWEIDPTDPEHNRLQVRYQNYFPTRATKDPIA